jgi:hypothetical protein
MFSHIIISLGLILYDVDSLGTSIGSLLICLMLDFLIGLILSFLPAYILLTSVMLLSSAISFKDKLNLLASTDSVSPS